MKIVQVNETCGTGSIGRLSVELSNYAEAHGHSVLFIHASANNNAFHNTYRVGSELDHITHAVLSRITGLQGYFSAGATKRLINKLEEFQPDIVHLENLHGNYINLKLLLGFLADRDIATVITLHDCWFYTGKCTSYVPVNCRKWQKECGNCPLLRIDNVNKTYFFDTTRRCIRDKKRWLEKVPRLMIVGISSWVTSEAKQSFLKDRDINEIRNWVTQDIFCYRESNIRQALKINDKKVVLFVSTYLSAKKGYDVMIQLADKLGPEYQIVVIGSNVANFIIPTNVIHLEHTNNAIELAEYYSTADVCVNTTKYETFGMVTAESISCGTPVIVYNNTASPELIGDGCGVVVEEKNGIDEIIQSIHRLTAGDRKDQRNVCIEYAKKVFSPEVQLSRYINCYELLLKEKGANVKDGK